MSSGGHCLRPRQPATPMNPKMSHPLPPASTEGCSGFLQTRMRRRDAMHIGFCTALGLGMGDFLRLQAESKLENPLLDEQKAKSVIHLHLHGPAGVLGSETRGSLRVPGGVWSVEDKGGRCVQRELHAAHLRRRQDKRGALRRWKDSGSRTSHVPSLHRIHSHNGH